MTCYEGKGNGCIRLATDNAENLEGENDHWACMVIWTLSGLFCEANLYWVKGTGV